MSFNIRDYVSDDHVESIGEIAKNQSAIIQALSLDNSQKDKEIERLNNDIKVLLKENENKEKVIIAQDNIINELEQWLYDNTNYEEYDRVEKDTFNYVIKKIEELRNEEK